MINVTGDLLTDLYAKNMLGEVYPEYCFSSVKNIDCTVTTSTTATSVIATLTVNNRTYKAEERFSDHLNLRLAVTSSIGKAIIEFASSEGRKTPPYGVLTGVRPFKIAVDLLSRFDYDEVIKRLNKTYLVTNGKIELLLNAAMYDQKIRSNHHKNDASVYLSIPFCPSRCNYCSFISSAAPSKLQLLDLYVDELIKEIYATSKVIERNGLNVKSVYIGGGTPTVLASNQLERVLAAVADALPSHSLCEFTVEAGRPDTITEEKLTIMRDFGINRTCVNCQSTDDEILRSIGRNHTSADFFKAFELVQSYGFETVNTDIIAGFDGDTPETFQKTVDDVLSLCPESITVHTLSVKKSSAIKVEDTMNLEKNIDDFIEYSKNACILAGFLPYYLYKQKYAVGNHENVGYCLRSHECYYNIAMMNEIEHIFGLGAGATSRIIGSNENGKIEHFANFKYPTEYIGGFDKINSNLADMEEHLKRI